MQQCSAVLTEPVSSSEMPKLFGMKNPPCALMMGRKAQQGS